ncbi:MAG: iron-sulfur cluster assembly accessory protein [Rickettsiales bacterium]|nr:iron-sulfur cluster assembly accessory protein [Rickettsiales bacterium]
MKLQFTPDGNAIVDYLKITDGAFTQIKELLSNRKEPCEGIKVGIRTRGCSGLSYTIEYALRDKNISKFDDVVIRDGVAVFIDPKISMFLINSEMIYKEGELETGFDFINPNEKGRCGCGESFKT